jgi:hypothetical protein
MRVPPCSIGPSGLLFLILVIQGLRVSLRSTLTPGYLLTAPAALRHCSLPSDRACGAPALLATF